MVTAGLTGFPPETCRRLVVKIGSSLLVDKAGAIRAEWLESVVAELAERHAAGQQIIIVSSGAIALGARRLGLPKGGRGSLDDAQAAAAVGQISLSQSWAELLAARGITAAQMLLTLDDLQDRRRYLNASATLERLLALGALPVINENDSVSTDEIRVGDNDRLAARIGQAAQADAVLLLSDVDGLYTANPHSDPRAELIPQVKRIDAGIVAMADGGSGSGMGSGGMATKIEAARMAVTAGIHLAITSGLTPAPLSRWQADGRGTIFIGQKGRRARKSWLSGHFTTRGTIMVDAGAAAALARGNSLLPAGVTAVSGQFSRGDVLDIIAPGGERIARGLAEHDAADAIRIAGKRSEDIAQILGETSRTVLVHRDHMVIL